MRDFAKKTSSSNASNVNLIGDIVDFSANGTSQATNNTAGNLLLFLMEFINNKS